MRDDGSETVYPRGTLDVRRLTVLGERVDLCGPGWLDTTKWSLAAGSPNATIVG